MTRDDIVEKLRQVMKKAGEKTVDWNSVTEESPIASLGFDSLSILDLLYDIQQTFGVEFDAEELTGVTKVADLVAFLETKVV